MSCLRQSIPSLRPLLRSVHTSAKAAERKRFFVYAPDCPNSVARRYVVREAHLAGVKRPIETGIIPVAGMLADPEQPQIKIGGETRNNAVASILIIEANTLEEARQLIESDVYWKEGVWDKERVIVQPFFAATPFP